MSATHGVVCATAVDEVRPALRAVEAATSRGLWAFGFVAYEAAPAFDPGFMVHPPAPGLPLVWFGLGVPPEPVAPVRPAGGSGYDAGPWALEWDEERHGRAVEAVRRWIAEGDTYQVNLTGRLRGGVSGDLTRLYADLATAQAGGHNAYLDTGRFVIAGASPELFFERRGSRIVMRPMKGTARRGATAVEDQLRRIELCESAKERAENVMIVDLVRNDLARVSTVGGVRVIELCRPETYPTVHQLTSEVVAEIDPATSLEAIFEAVFPCGSITGAPKRRTMEIITELETGPRGVYTGAVGLVGPGSGPADAAFNVPIRTLLVDRESGRGLYGAGGGITWSSRPAAEFDELLAKTAVLPTGGMSVSGRTEVRPAALAVGAE